MATHADHPDQATLTRLLQTRRALAWGFLWAALVFFPVFHFWFTAREAPLWWLLVGLMDLLFAMCAWVACRLFLSRPRPTTPPEEAVPALLRERKHLSLLLYIGALILLGVGLGLAWEDGLKAFPEASSCVVLALIAGGTGLFLSSAAAPGQRQQRFLEWVRQNPRGILRGLIALALLVMGLAGWRFREAGVTPESVGAALLLLTFGGLALWIALKPPGTATVQDMRVLVLLAGGLTGLIVALMTFWRVYLWWDDIFPRAVPMAMSEGIWMLWLCIYVALAALALLFGSLLLARAEVRDNPVMRRLLFGYNAGLTGLLTLGALVLLNVAVFITLPLNLEWSSGRGLHGLSSSTKNLLENLKEPVRVYALMSPFSPAYEDTQTLLNNCEAYTRLFQVEYLSPDKDWARYRRLAEKYPAIVNELRMAAARIDEEAGRGVLLVYGPDVAEKGRSEFIPVEQLGELTGDPENPKKRTVLYKGEDVIMTKLRLLVDGEKKPKVYFTQSNDELNLQNNTMFTSKQDQRGGAGLLLERLKQDNYDVRGLIWGAPEGKLPPGDLFVFSKKTAKDPDRVPDDAKLVIVAHPRVPFEADALAALEQYMERGGQMIVLSNFLLNDVNLGGLLRKYNVEATKDYVVRFVRRPDEDPLLLRARTPPGSKNKVAANFRDESFPVGGWDPRTSVDPVRVVRPLKQPGPYSAEPLLQVQTPPERDFWAASDPGAWRDPWSYLSRVITEPGGIEARKSPDPLPVGVVVTRDQRPRLVVLGDARFASNRHVNSKTPYYDFLTSSIEWLAERPGNIGIKPKESHTYNPKLEEADRSRVIWLPLGLILLSVVGLGTGIWVVRRR